MSEEKRNVPKLRFPGFTDPWEQRKLGELFYERTHRSSDRDILSVSISNGIYPASESDRDTNPGASIKNYKIVNTNDIVYNSMRLWQGAVGCSKYEGIVSPAYVVVSPKTGVDSPLFGYLLKLPVMLHRFANYSQGNSKDTLTLKFDKFAEIRVVIPVDIAEQKALSAFFQKLDNLITLHQRKLDHLKEMKKGLLQKMFPKNGETVPELRFPGFTDPWEQRKALHLAEYSKGKGYSKDDLVEKGTPIILYGRLYTNYQAIIDEVDTFAKPNNDAIYSQGNEVIVPASGETAEDIARASVVLLSGVLLGGDLNILRPNRHISPLFLALTLSNGVTQRELAKRAQGKSVVHIHNSDIQDVMISFPAMKEQTQIGAFFQQLDSLITLHQRKLNHLKDMKKGLLQQMFV